MTCVGCTFFWRVCVLACVSVSAWQRRLALWDTTLLALCYSGCIPITLTVRLACCVVSLYYRLSRCTARTATRGKLCRVLSPNIVASVRRCTHGNVFFGFVVGSPTVCTLSSKQTKDEASVRSPRSSPWKTSLIPHRHPVDYISTNLHIEPRRCDASWRPDTYVYHSIYCLSLLQHYWLSNWCVRGRSSAELRDI